MFVAIHEMGHVISKGIGHDAEFWNNMGWLLTQAERGGFYTPQNFQAHPTMYCGITITDAPRYDPAKDESAGTDLQIGTIGS
jgi:hypothetical protein